MKTINVAIADDHKIVRDGIGLLVSKIRGIQVSIIACDGYDLLAKLAKADPLPDVILLDLDMKGPGGKGTIKDLKLKYQEIKVVIVSAHINPTQIFTAFRQGTDGYISKEGGLAELETAIRRVLKSDLHICPIIAEKWPDLTEQILEGGAKGKLQELNRVVKELTPLDMAIIQHISNGLKSKEIAEALHMSVRTVEGRRSKILERTESANAADLIRKAKEKGWCV
jgi:two-component system, NarL family, response regulator DegU